MLGGGGSGPRQLRDLAPGPHPQALGMRPNGRTLGGGILECSLP